MHILHKRPRAGSVLGAAALLLVAIGGVTSLAAREGGGDTAPPVMLKPNMSYFRVAGNVPGGGWGKLDLTCPKAKPGIFSGGAAVGRANHFIVASYPRVNATTRVPKIWRVYVSNEEPLVSSGAEMSGFLLCGKTGVRLVAPEAQ